MNWTGAGVKQGDYYDSWEETIVTHMRAIIIIKKSGKTCVEQQTHL